MPQKILLAVLAAIVVFSMTVLGRSYAYADGNEVTVTIGSGETAPYSASPVPTTCTKNR